MPAIVDSTALGARSRWRARQRPRLLAGQPLERADRRDRRGVERDAAQLPGARVVEAGDGAAGECARPRSCAGRRRRCRRAGPASARAPARRACPSSRASDTITAVGRERPQALAQLPGGLVVEPLQAGRRPRPAPPRPSSRRSVQASSASAAGPSSEKATSCGASALQLPAQLPATASSRPRRPRARIRGATRGQRAARARRCPAPHRPGQDVRRQRRLAPRAVIDPGQEGGQRLARRGDRRGRRSRRRGASPPAPRASRRAPRPTPGCCADGDQRGDARDLRVEVLRRSCRSRSSAAGRARPARDSRRAGGSACRCRSAPCARRGPPIGRQTILAILRRPRATDGSTSIRKTRSGSITGPASSPAARAAR